MRANNLISVMPLDSERYHYFLSDKQKNQTTGQKLGSQSSKSEIEF